jgi:pimeloyl-ACP methyl ester carboxylesterase
MIRNLHVVDSGSAERGTVVWLHGALVAGWMWTEQVARLPGRRHLVPDLPGIGGSYGAACASIDDAADILIELCRARSPGAAVDLVGLSLGAVVGLRMLSRAPELFGRAVLSGPLARPVTGPLAWLQTLILALYHRPMAAGVVARVLGLPADVRNAFLDTARTTPRETYRRLLPELYAHPVRTDQLPQIHHPLLLVTGSRDTAVTRNSVLDLLAALPRAEGYWADGLGHQWNAENGALFADMVGAWLDDAPLPPGLTRIESSRCGHSLKH